MQYLNFPADPTRLHAIREFSPDAAPTGLVAKTSQFACFSANRDSSVFVGASANRSSPTVLLLLRITRREFTLCEHKATRPETVSPLFSPTAGMCSSRATATATLPSTAFMSTNWSSRPNLTPASAIL